jgi:lipoprotein-anchoring transpeptidase ErfK/SrfK
MNDREISRRHFLELGKTWLLGALVSPAIQFVDNQKINLFSYKKDSHSLSLGRVTRKSIKVYQEPDFSSPTTGKLARDHVVQLQEETDAIGPVNNPVWYRFEHGYIHSAYIQPIENIQSNSPITSIPESGILAEVTVPYTQAFYRNRQGVWKDVYRLYYQSIHWITDVQTNPYELGDSGEVFYRITDEWLKYHYWVHAEHMRPVKTNEFDPISAHEPEENKKIVVSLTDQSLMALLQNQVVFACKVSTGVKYKETPSGEFFVNRKYPSKHMGNGGLTNDLLAYELPGIPWTTFFSDTGIAFHGTYWHNNFGTPMSHGCVNMKNQDALWLFRWTHPIYRIDHEAGKQTWNVESKIGTRVVIK